MNDIQKWINDTYRLLRLPTLEVGQELLTLKSRTNNLAFAQFAIGNGTKQSGRDIACMKPQYSSFAVKRGLQRWDIEKQTNPPRILFSNACRLRSVIVGAYTALTMMAFITTAFAAGVDGGSAADNNDEAIGPFATANGLDSVSIGWMTQADAQNGIAIGTLASASEYNSVAIGARAVTSRGPQTYIDPFSGATVHSVGEVSFGDIGNERQLTNVAPGSAPTDAATVGQLQSAVGGLLSQANAYTNNVTSGILSSAETYANGVGSSTLSSANSYANSVISSTLSSAYSYTNSSSLAALNAARSYSDGVGSSTLISADNYAMSVGASTLTSANNFATSYANGVGSSTLTAADHYTDTSNTTTLTAAKTYADGVGS